MAAKRIRLYGEPILRKQARPVDCVDEDTKGLAESLVATVDEAGGLGLAAPQIGVSERVIVVVEIDSEGDRTSHVMINPEIVSACGEETSEEGCLSIPEIYANVKRAKSVVVTGLDTEGREVTVEANGIMARAFAHEIDHLDGILFIDRIGMVKRSLLKRKLNEIKKKAKEMSRKPL
jgi:peptide deformylase